MNIKELEANALIQAEKAAEFLQQWNFLGMQNVNGIDPLENSKRSAQRSLVYARYEQQKKISDEATKALIEAENS